MVILMVNGFKVLGESELNDEDLYIMKREPIYEAQSVRRTWSAALEAVSRVLSDANLNESSNAELARKIVMAIGFKCG